MIAPDYNYNGDEENVPESDPEDMMASAIIPDEAPKQEEQ